MQDRRRTLLVGVHAGCEFRDLLMQRLETLDNHLLVFCEVAGEHPRNGLAFGCADMLRAGRASLQRLREVMPIAVEGRERLLPTLGEVSPERTVVTTGVSESGLVQTGAHRGPRIRADEGIAAVPASMTNAATA